MPSHPTPLPSVSSSLPTVGFRGAAPPLASLAARISSTAADLVSRPAASQGSEEVSVPMVSWGGGFSGGGFRGGGVRGEGREGGGGKEREELGKRRGGEERSGASR